MISKRLKHILIISSVLIIILLLVSLNEYYTLPEHTPDIIKKSCLIKNVNSRYYPPHVNYKNLKVNNNNETLGIFMCPEVTNVTAGVYFGPGVYVYKLSQKTELPDSYMSFYIKSLNIYNNSKYVCSVNKNVIGDPLNYNYTMYLYTLSLNPGNYTFSITIVPVLVIFNIYHIAGKPSNVTIKDFEEKVVR